MGENGERTASLLEPNFHQILAECNLGKDLEEYMQDIRRSEKTGQKHNKTWVRSVDCLETRQMKYTMGYQVGEN